MRDETPELNTGSILQLVGALAGVVAAVGLLLQKPELAATLVVIIILLRLGIAVIDVWRRHERDGSHRYSKRVRWLSLLGYVLLVLIVVSTAAFVKPINNILVVAFGGLPDNIEVAKEDEILVIVAEFEKLGA